MWNLRAFSDTPKCRRSCSCVCVCVRVVPPLVFVLIIMAAMAAGAGNRRPRVVAFVTGELYGSVADALATQLLACALVCVLRVFVCVLLLNYACQRAYRACLCVCASMWLRLLGLDPYRMAVAPA